MALQFDGIYQRSEVWINGISLGMRPYRFISFSYDVTPHLAPLGKSNHIAVRVDNSLQTNCRWYSGSGIYRHSWLRITDPIHIAENGICVRTPSITSESAAVEITTRLHNESGRDADLELTTEILAPTGETLQQITTSHTLSKDTQATLAQTLTIASSALWSTTTPHLYRARCSVRSRGTLIDQDSTSFGIRHIAFDVDRGFLLNGEHVKMNGICIHGDGGAVGTAVPERLWELRLELLQQMGCNAIRLSHNPPAPVLLDMLDRMGFLVMDEAFDEWRHAKGQTPIYGYHRYFDGLSERQLLLLPEPLDEATRSASAAHWNWPGKEGKIIPVTCFTNCETVELFLNGESLGVKGYTFPRLGMVGPYGNYPPGANALRTTADLHLTWDVPYAPGTLTAKGIKDGKPIEAVEVYTTGAPAKLALINDRPHLRTTPDDLAHVTVAVQDAQGRIVPTADDALTFSLTGAGRILGVDNGQPDSHEPYKASSRRAFNGLALVLVQSNGRPGQITLSASAPSLALSQIIIEAS